MDGAKTQALGTRPEWRVGSHGLPLALGGALIAGGWTPLWGADSYWNPLAFTAMWTGAALAMWGGSRQGYPSILRHAALVALSVPLWWWFELVNWRVRNWEYLAVDRYSDLAFGVLSSTAFSTVVPALVAATAFLSGLFTSKDGTPSSLHRAAWWVIGLGLLFQAAVFAVPKLFFPFVWVAPFLVVDAAASLLGQRSLLAGMLRGRWREPALIAGAGLLCGFLWEFWNYWAVPKWVYHVPFVGFTKVFEMPILGYLGYVPFAWSVVQLVGVLDAVWERKSSALSSFRRKSESMSSGHRLPPV